MEQHLDIENAVRAFREKHPNVTREEEARYRRFLRGVDEVFVFRCRVEDNHRENGLLIK